MYVLQPILRLRFISWYFFSKKKNSYLSYPSFLTVCKEVTAFRDLLPQIGSPIGFSFFSFFSFNLLFYKFRLFFQTIGVGWAYQLRFQNIWLVSRFSHLINIPLVSTFTAQLRGRKKRLLLLHSYSQKCLYDLTSLLRPLPVNPYTGKGFRVRYQYIFRKVGKKKFV